MYIPFREINVNQSQMLESKDAIFVYIYQL